MQTGIIRPVGLDSPSHWPIYNSGDQNISELAQTLQAAHLLTQTMGDRGCGTALVPAIQGVNARAKTFRQSVLWMLESAVDDVMLL